MTSRIRFYMTFNEKWLKKFEVFPESLYEALEKGFNEYGEVFISLECHDGTAILDMISDRASDVLEDIINESFSKCLPVFDESDFDIEIDLDVLIVDFDSF